MRSLDFSSWHSLLFTLVGLALFTLIGVGVRLLAMVTLQQRRERMNRQINERLKVLINAYKVLGSSFTGDITVDPTHLRDVRQATFQPDSEEFHVDGSERKRRIRDAVEAALSDVILLGTEEHVRLAYHAATELVAGRPVHTHDLVVSLRDFIRAALDLDPMPIDISISKQGPARPSGGNDRKKGDGEKRSNGGGLGNRILGNNVMGAGPGAPLDSDETRDHGNSPGY